MKLRITLEARADLVDIHTHGVRQFGEAQAERYQRGFIEAFRALTEFPLVNRERPELGPGRRTQMVGSHIVFYRIEEDTVVIIRVRHGREDWRPE